VTKKGVKDKMKKELGTWDSRRKIFGQENTDEEWKTCSM